MLLTINAQNTFITLGCFRKGKLTTVTQLATEPHHTADQYACAIASVLQLHQVDLQQIGGAVLCSVVPALSGVLRQAVETLFHCPIVCVSAGVKTGLNMKIDNPHMLGSDLVCLAVEAVSRGKLPCVVVDLGTATTFTAVDRNGVMVGTAIAPGVRLSLEALREQAAQLPSVTLDRTPSLIGKNTQDAIRSGVLCGAASMVDGMVRRMRAQLGDGMTVYLTGQDADAVGELMEETACQEPSFALMGLQKIWERNKKK
ncbi:MAG: type III pantothenate kinase [Butyricicoccus sp.]